MPYDPDPAPAGPISVTRAEYDAACRRLSDAGATLKPDRDRAWPDFVGCRVNYDALLLRFASLCMAPPAPWSSDRSVPSQQLQSARRRSRPRI